MACGRDGRNGARAFLVRAGFRRLAVEPADSSSATTCSFRTPGRMPPTTSSSSPHCCRGTSSPVSSIGPGTPPGTTLPPKLLEALERSSSLVVIASPAAERSIAVGQEVEYFKSTGRPIVPVDVDGSLAKASWYPLIEGIASTPETFNRVSAATPNQAVLDRIVPRARVSDSYRARAALHPQGDGHRRRNPRDRRDWCDGRRLVRP